MYGIFTYIWAMFGVNVGKYSIHGASGYIYIYHLCWLHTKFRLEISGSTELACHCFADATSIIFPGVGAYACVPSIYVCIYIYIYIYVYIYTPGSSIAT